MRPPGRSRKRVGALPGRRTEALAAEPEAASAERRSWVTVTILSDIAIKLIYIA
jgi:hypothetical protein